MTMVQNNSEINSIGTSNPIVNSRLEDDDFSVKKPEIAEKHRQRYSQLATILTEKEVENFRKRITDALNPKE